MRFDDALFNWLQIELVAEARPDDGAASDTRDFFLQILTEDHHVTSIAVEATDEAAIHVRYEKDGVVKVQRFPREAGEQLLNDINANPKYN